MAECVVCKQSFNDSELLFGDRGPTCAVCMVATDEGAETTKRLWTLIVAPPVVASLAVFALCIPLIGLFLSLFMSAVALFGGLSAIQSGYRLEPEEAGVKPEMKSYLMASGIVTTVVAIGSTGFFVMMLGLVVASQLL